MQVHREQDSVLLPKVEKQVPCKAIVDWHVAEQLAQG